jgi:capsular polysaccharide transport system permease protein
MSNSSNQTEAQTCVITRMDPPHHGSSGKPLVVGSEDSGWTAGRIALLVTLCIVPSALAVLYYGLVAADLYVSDSQFVVRSQSQSGAGLIEGIGEGAGVTVGATDANSIISYIRSRDALQAVSGRINLRQAFGAPNGDILSRFPGLFSGDTAEDLFFYYLSHVRADHNKTTGVTTLTVYAFDAVTAQTISHILLQEAERIVNGLSERMRTDSLTQVQQHLAEAGRQLQTAQLAMQDWRIRERMYDPELYSKSVVEVVTSLSIAIAEARAQRQALLDTSPRNSAIKILDNKIATLQQQIGAEWSSLAGENESLTPQISEYERLVIDRDLSVKLYAAANESLERVRSEVRRQSVFVERISEPQAADKPLYPRRLLNTFFAIAIAFMTFLLFDRLAANIRRHRRLAEYVALRGTING